MKLKTKPIIILASRPPGGARFRCRWDTREGRGSKVIKWEKTEAGRAETNITMCLYSPHGRHRSAKYKVQQSKQIQSCR